MKAVNVYPSIILLLLMGCSFLFAQEDVVVTPLSEAAEGLDLQAISELFKESEDLESFENSLNDPETGIHDLDLDENGEVDFIRVVEEVADETHVIILQVPLGEDDFQDVATIEIEKTGEESFNMQVHGNEDLYGSDYYVTPASASIHTWPIIRHIYRPVYRPYRSNYRWGYYPVGWRKRRPVGVSVYRTRVHRYRTSQTFIISRKGRVMTIHKVGYKPRRSVRVKRRTRRVAPRPPRRR